MYCKNSRHSYKSKCILCTINGIGMSLIDKTEKEYAAKLKTIFSTYGVGMEGPLTEIEIHGIFVKIHRSKLATNTVKKYRAVLYWYAERHQIELDKSKFRISKMRKYSRKLKSYDLSTRAKMLAHIGRLKPPYNAFLFNHLICGALVGYRLIELIGLHVELQENDKMRVKILNGKATNGRSLGKVREFEVGRYFNGIDIFQSLSELVKIAEEQEDYDDFLVMMSAYHSRLVREVFPKDEKLPTMSSLRHQFKLNLIAGGKTDLEVSAMFGHISDETQKRRYGRKSNGKGFSSPSEVEYASEISVSPDLVSQVRLVSKANMMSRSNKVAISPSPKR